MKHYKYPQPYDVEQAMSNDFVSADFLQKFAESKGIFLPRMKQSPMSKFLSGFFYEKAELDKIQECTSRNNPNRTLTTMKYVMDNETFLEDNISPIDAFEKYKRELKQSGKNPDNIKISNPIIVSQGDAPTKHKIDVEFTKSKKGRVEFLKKEKHFVSVYIEELTPSTFQITSDCGSSADSKMIEKILKKVLKREGTFKKIDLDILRPHETIIFFDRLNQNGMNEDWDFQEITKITIKKPNTEEEESVQKDKLLGINRAMLEGEDLRNNEFVKNCQDSNYRFIAMTYKFRHIPKPFVIEISAESKGNPKVFEIAIKKYKKEEITAEGDSLLEHSDFPENKMEIKQKMLSESEHIYQNILRERNAPV